MTIAEELDLFVKLIQNISENKNYWLIRTQSGFLYDTFRNNGYIALEHNEVSLSFLDEKKKEFGDDFTKRYESIREHVRQVHKQQQNLVSDEDINTRKASVVASQISKFTYDIKKDDLVIIPSDNLEVISFGVIAEGYIAEFTEDEKQRIKDPYILKKRVNWIKDIKKRNIDPYLYKMFSAHQAICNVRAYAEIIERSMSDIFVLDDEAHYIINTMSTDDIPAKDLFGLGSDILCLIDDFAKEFNLDIKSSDLQVTININSPGKIDLKSKIRKTTIVVGLILFVCGGGYKTAEGTEISTKGIPAVLKAISDFLNENQERAMKQQIFDQYKDSLDIQQPEDMINLLKQVSENKDLSKQ